jgi:hypothetical protein
MNYTYKTTQTGYSNHGFSQPTTSGTTEHHAVLAISVTGTTESVASSTPTKTRTAAEIQQGFVNASKAERVRLKEWFDHVGITEFKFTDDDGYDSVDGYFRWNDKKYVTEAKNRNITQGQYQTHPFELRKYEALKAAYHSRGHYHPLFIVFCTDGAILYNLKTRIDNEINNCLLFKVDSKFPKTTMGSSSATCTRLIAEIRKDLEQWKDKVYTYKPM